MNLIGFLLFAVAGIAFNPSATNAPTAARIVPTGSGTYKMVLPDRKTRLFSEDPSRPGVIQSERPWIGVVEKNRVRVWPDEGSGDGVPHTVLTFRSGQLRNVVLGEKSYDFPAGVPVFSDTFESLWPERKTRGYEKNSAADIWKGGNRLRLWFANPNSAGCFAAFIALVGLALLFVRAALWKAVGAGVTVVGLVLLSMTQARGALVGFVAGAVPMCAFSLRRRLTARRITMMAAGAIVLCGLVFVTPFGTRLVNSVKTIDAGNMLRIKVAKAAACMFAEAPGGWHIGEIPDRHAALNWYVTDEKHGIRTHLLTVSGLGWVEGFGYLSFWLLTLALGFAFACRGVTLLFGLWTAFFLSGFFNPVYTEGTLWLTVGVLTVGAAFLSRRTWMPKGVSLKTIVKYAAVVFGGAALSIAVFILCGKLLTPQDAIPIRSKGKAVFVNGTEARAWVVEDPLVLGGRGFPGREVLAYYVENRDAPALAYVGAVADLPRKVKRLVLPGRAAADYLAAFAQSPDAVCQADEILFLSPSLGPENVPDELLKRSEVVWMAGNFAAMRIPDAYREKRPWVYVIPGVEQYVPNWIELVLQ